MVVDRILGPLYFLVICKNSDLNNKTASLFKFEPLLKSTLLEISYVYFSAAFERLHLSKEKISFTNI